MVDIPKPKIEGFVIYNPANGLFSGGGMPPSWSKKPKIWNNIGHVKNHLHGALGPYLHDSRNKICRLKSVYKGCVVYDVTTDQDTGFDIYKFVLDHWNKSYYAEQGYVIKYV